MHVVILTPVFPPYKAGMAQVALQHASFLREGGHKVTVITPRYGNDGINGKEEGVLRVCSRLTLGNAAYIPTFDEGIDSIKNADAILLEYPFIDCIGALKKIMKDDKEKKLWVYYHMDLVAHNWKKIPFAYYTAKALTFFKGLQKQGRLHIAGSSRDYMSGSEASVLRASITEVPIGVDGELFVPQVNDFLQKKLGIASEKKIALFVGALDKAHAFKGVEDLIAAVKEKENVAVVIIGDGDKRKEFEETAKGNHNIHFLGKVGNEELVKAYQSADVVVLPSSSSSEAFGIVLVEAQLCGTSVIASDLRGVRGVVNPKTGILVPPQEREQLSQALDKIPKKDEEIMRKNREFAERWSYQNAASQFIRWVKQDIGE